MAAVTGGAVERYSGDPADAPAFLMRFRAAAQERGYLAFYTGRRSLPARLEQAAIDAMPASDEAGVRAKAAAAEARGTWLEEMASAHHFVLRAADAATGLRIEDAVRDGEQRPDKTYRQLLAYLQDDSAPSLGRLACDIVGARASCLAEVPPMLVRQAQLRTRLARAGYTVPDLIVNAINLMHLPEDA